MSAVLIHTGPLVAMICADDRDHAWAVKQFRGLTPPLLTCEPVIAEACFLIERRGLSGAIILERIENGLLRIAVEVEDHGAALKKLMLRYASAPMSPADSCPCAARTFRRLPAGDLGCLYLRDEMPITPRSPDEVQRALRHQDALRGAWPSTGSRTR